VVRWIGPPTRTSRPLGDGNPRFGRGDDEEVDESSDQGSDDDSGNGMGVIALIVAAPALFAGIAAFLESRR
jgi:hypothetical protein